MNEALREKITGFMIYRNKVKTTDYVQGGVVQ